WWTVHGIQLPFYFVGVLCLLNATMVFKYLPESLSIEKRHASHTELPLSEMLNHADGPIYVTVAMCYFVYLTGFSIMTAVFALFGQHRFGLDGAHIGYIMALIGIIAVVMQGGVIRRLLPKYGEVKLARTGMVILLFSFVFLPIAGSMATLLTVSS